MSFVTQGSIPEVVEKVSGSSLDDRTSILDSIQDLGPPDMIHLKKHNSTSNTKHPDIGTYFYYTGADVSSSASIAALLNSISNIIGESPQLWFGKNKPWKVREATYCTYNAFSKMDIRVTVNFPGGVEYIIIDCDGNQLILCQLLKSEKLIHSYLLIKQDYSSTVLNHYSLMVLN
ncbi:unnamed protein product [[Candida] boidinii]|uniref:Unnamed protein product n=1 Tax=Candida boidinii TaxID=5477 RepID=A0A9W6T8F8_CANBO|nr:unnamed protein product [[Candida] boidinii]GMG20214.1 unnamed protein product [[Candida] boidinii]